MLRIVQVIVCAVLIVAILGGPSEGQQPPFATTKVDGTDNVYIFRYGNHQAMFIVTSAGVIATDPIGYGRPQAVTTYVDEIRKITNQPIRYVIYSHHQEKEMELPKYASWPNYKQALPFVLRRYCGLWGRGT